MSETKWTPGPWKCEGGGYLPITAIREGKGCQIGRAESCGSRLPSEEVEANGSLFAAAPDLYMEMDALVCDGCGHRIGWTGEHDAEQSRLERTDWRSCRHCKHARAALAKARGEDAEPKEREQ